MGVIEINRHVTARAGIPTRANSRSGQSFQSDLVASFDGTLLHGLRRLRKLPSAQLEVLDDSLGNPKAALLGKCLAETGDLHFLEREGNVDGFVRDDGIWQDGGLLFEFPNQNQWTAIFLKFQSWLTLLK